MPLTITKPTVGGNNNAWGGILNAALDAIKSFVDALETAIGNKADLASPALTGNPTAPTPATTDSDTSIANTAMVQAAIDAKRGKFSAVNAQTGTSYTPVLADVGKIVTLTNAAAITLTIPANATTAFAIGDTITFVAKGAGMVTVAMGGAATKVPTGSLVTRQTGSVFSITKVATDEWVVSGDFA